MEISGSVALVTGGASGLGEACVRNLVGEGAKVAILDLAAEKGEQLARQLGTACLFRSTDVTDESSVRAAVEETFSRFGAVHVAVNCAGTAAPAKVLGKSGPMPLERFETVIRVNLIGTMNVIRFAAERMIRNAPNQDGETGVIINTASGAAFEGQVGQAAYSASKAGVVGMTLPIAREFADYGIRNVTIAPGLFDTPMLGALSDPVRESLIKTCLFPRRMGRPPEFAALVDHIIRNPMLNGATLRLDGALRLPPR